MTRDLLLLFRTAPIDAIPELSYQETLATSSRLTNTTIAYWPFSEASGVTAFDHSANNRNAVYSSNVVLAQSGIGDGNTAVRFNAAASITISGVAPNINKSQGTFSVWYKPTSSGVLTDGVARYLFYSNIDAQNTFYFRKQAANNQYAAVHLGNNVNKSVSFTSTQTDWTNLVITWASLDCLRLYLNGTPISPSASGLSPLVGSFSTMFMGATSALGANRWDGSLAHGRFHDRVLTSADIALLAHCSGHVIFEGDSRTITSDFTTAYPTVSMANATIVAKRYGFYNSGTSGQEITQFGTTDIDEQYRASFNNIVVIFGGINDANAGASAQTIYERLLAWGRARRRAGFTVIVCTEIDGQDAGRNAVGWHTTILPALNTLIRTNWQLFADDIIDFGANSRFQDALNTLYYNVDAIHPNALGQSAMASIAIPVLLRHM